MVKRQLKYISLVVLACLSAGCGSGNVEYKYPQKIKGQYEMVTADEAERKNDTLFDKKYLTFNINRTEKAKTEQVIETKEENRKIVSEKQPLWANVLPILSRYPIAELHQDSFISTEWFSDAGNSSGQLKINAVKIGENAEITVLCRQKDKNGEWINQKNDEALADMIKNDIVKQSLNN